MKKCLFLILVLVVSGCASLVSKIPENEFDYFEYDRSGNATKAKVVATKGSISDGILTIEEVDTEQQYGPFFELRMRIEGLKIKLGEKDK